MHGEVEIGSSLDRTTISDMEKWPCVCCGVRGLATERLIITKDQNRLRIPLGIVRVCPRCYRLEPGLAGWCAWYLAVMGQPLPQLEEWLAKETEPQFDIMGMILKQHGVVTTDDEPPVEPYKPSKIIVPIGG